MSTSVVSGTCPALSRLFLVEKPHDEMRQAQGHQGLSREKVITELCSGPSSEGVEAGSVSEKLS